MIYRNSVSSTSVFNPNDPYDTRSLSPYVPAREVGNRQDLPDQQRAYADALAQWIAQQTAFASVFGGLPGSANGALPDPQTYAAMYRSLAGQDEPSFGQEWNEELWNQFSDLGTSDMKPVEAAQEQDYAYAAYRVYEGDESAQGSGLRGGQQEDDFSTQDGAAWKTSNPILAGLGIDEKPSPWAIIQDLMFAARGMPATTM